MLGVAMTMGKRAQHIKPGEIIVALGGRVIDNHVLPSHCIISWKKIYPEPLPEDLWELVDRPTHTLTCDLDHFFELTVDWKTEKIQQSIALSSKAPSQYRC